MHLERAQRFENISKAAFDSFLFFYVGFLIAINFLIWILIYKNIRSEKSAGIGKLKKHLVSKIVLTCDCLNKLFQWTQKVCKFSAFSFEFQKCFSITRTIFSHSRSEQFWKQNTILKQMQKNGTFSISIVHWPAYRKG